MAMKLQSPTSIKDSNSDYELIHVTWVSAGAGFLDDMYLMVVNYPNDNKRRAINIQSQIRIGTCDYE